MCLFPAAPNGSPSVTPCSYVWQGCLLLQDEYLPYSRQRHTLFQAMHVTDIDAAAGSCQVHKGLTDAGSASLSILA